MALVPNFPALVGVGCLAWLSVNYFNERSERGLLGRRHFGNLLRAGVLFVGHSLSNEVSSLAAAWIMAMCHGWHSLFLARVGWSHADGDFRGSRGLRWSPSVTSKSSLCPSLETLLTLNNGELQVCYIWDFSAAPCCQFHHKYFFWSPDYLSLTHSFRVWSWAFVCPPDVCMGFLLAPLVSTDLQSRYLSRYSKLILGVNQDTDAHVQDQGVFRPYVRCSWDTTSAISSFCLAWTRRRSACLLRSWKDLWTVGFGSNMSIVWAAFLVQQILCLLFWCDDLSLLSWQIWFMRPTFESLSSHANVTGVLAQPIFAVRGSA